MSHQADGFISRADYFDIVTLGEMDVAPDISIQFTRQRADHAWPEQLVSFGGRDVDSVVLFLEATPSSTIFVGSDRIDLEPAERFDCALHDLRPAQTWLTGHRVDIATFDVPSRALDRWAAENDVRAMGGLHYESGLRRQDEVIKGFGLALLPFTRDPHRAPRIFVDQVLNAVCMHLVRTYGSTRSAPRRTGGLAPWQERRAKEKIDANLGNQISLKSLAEECRLSVSHFAKAFRESVGETPHQWLMQRRIDKSKSLLNDGRLALAEIAALCGFSDQSHFTRAFAQRVGVAPGAWRRASASHRSQTAGSGHFDSFEFGSSAIAAL